MKNINKISIIIIMLLIAAGVTFGQERDTRQLRRFTEIKVSEGIEVVAVKGNENSAEIETYRIDMDQVLTEVEDGVLRIGIRQRRSWWRGRSSKHDVKIRLIYNGEIERVVASTAASIEFNEELKGTRLDVSASTSGRVEMKIDVSRLDLSATTSGRVDIEGKAEDIKSSASTGGTIYAYDVNAKEVTVKVSTGADIRVRAEDYLEGSASTGGSVYYKGSPKTAVRTNTGGSIRKSN